MADIGVRLIVIGLGEFRRGITSAQGDISGLEKEIRSLSGSATSVGTQLTNLGNTISGVGRSLTLFATTPIIGLGTALETMGIKFEDGFAGITKTVDGLAIGFDEIKDMAKEQLGITVNSMDEARTAAERMGVSFGDLTPKGEAVLQQFRDLGREVPLPIPDLLHLGELIGALGVNKEQIADVTRTVAELGATTDLAAEDAAVGIIKFGNILHGTSLNVADFTQRAGSALVDLGNKSVSTEGEILDLTLRLAAAGQRANLTEPEILAWGTTLADLGVNAELGGTALSRVFNAMSLSVANGGDELELFAQITGKTTEQFASDFRNNASAAMLDFIEKFQLAIQNGQITEDMLTGTSLAGVRVIDVFGRLGGASDLFSKNLAVANEGWTENIALQDEAEKKFGTIASQIQMLKNTFYDLGLTILDLTKDKLVGFITMVEGLIDSFQKMSPAQQTVILTMAAIAAAIGPVLIVIGTLIAALGVVITAVASILTPMGLFVALVTALGLAFAAVLPVILGSQEAISIFNTLKDIFAALASFIELNVLPKLEEFGTQFVIWVLEKLNEFAVWFEANKGNIIGALETIMTKGLEAFGTISTVVSTFVIPALTTMGTILGTFWSILTEVGNYIGSTFNVNLAAIATTIGGIILTGLNNFSKWFEDNKVPITATLETILEIGKKVFDAFTTTLNNDIIPAFEKVNLAFQDTGITWETVAAVLSAVIIGLGAVITGILEGIAYALQAWADGWRMIIDGVQSIISGFQEVFKGWSDVIGGILTGDFGRFFDGWWEIWEGTFNLVKGLLETTAGFFYQIFAGILLFLGGFIDGVIQFFTNLSDELVGHSIIPDMINDIMSWFNKLPLAVQEVFGRVTGALNTFTAKINSVVNTVKTAVNTMIGDLRRLLSSITSSPTLTIQHPFERFEEYLKGADFTFDLNMRSIEGVSSVLNGASATNISNSNTTIDKSVNIGDISGVPMTRGDDLASLLTERLTIAQGMTGA